MSVRRTAKLQMDSSPLRIRAPLLKQQYWDVVAANERLLRGLWSSMVAWLSSIIRMKSRLLYLGQSAFVKPCLSTKPSNHHGPNTVAADIEPCLSAGGNFVAFGDVGNLVGFWETAEVRADIPEKLEPLTSRVFTHRAAINTLRTAGIGEH